MLLTISGPSGAGKTSIIDGLSNSYSCNALPSWTTRDKRNNEDDSTYYRFVTHKEYKWMSDRGDFVLEDQVSGNWYGTKELDIIEAIKGETLWIADFTTQSVIDLISKELMPRLVIFVYVDKDKSASRISMRGESVQMVQKRLLNYNTEIENIVKLATYYDRILFLDGNNNLSDSIKSIGAHIGKDE